MAERFGQFLIKHGSVMRPRYLSLLTFSKKNKTKPANNRKGQTSFSKKETCPCESIVRHPHRAKMPKNAFNPLEFLALFLHGTCLVNRVYPSVILYGEPFL